MSESYPTYCRIIFSTHRYSIASLDDNTMYAKRSPVQRGKRASHGEARCGGDAASRRSNVGQGEIESRRAEQRIGRKGPREQTYSRRYAQTSSFDGKTPADNAHAVSGDKETAHRFDGGRVVCRASLSNFAMRGYRSNAQPARESSDTRQINTKKYMLAGYIERKRTKM